MPEGYRPPSHGGNTASSIVPGAVATLRNGDAAATGSGTAATAGGGAAGGAAVARTRDGRQLSGTAVARPYSNVRYVSFPLYGPWGYSYPWYGWGFNYGFGYVNYNPWYYPGTHWIYGRYGYWYDPFAYDPYSYNMSYGAYGGTSDSGYSGGRDPYERRTGSVRLRVEPKNASVYIDGALVGTVDDFDGLTDHLELDAGSHELTLKAVGYQTYTGTISVPASRTTTERIKLKKQ